MITFKMINHSLQLSKYRNHYYLILNMSGRKKGAFKNSKMSTCFNILMLVAVNCAIGYYNYLDEGYEEIDLACYF